MRERIGFMQGRLVDQVDGKIQAFPAEQWRDEYPAAQRIGLQWMEWTLDAQGLEDNPLCTTAGREEIRRHSAQYGLNIQTLTGDCFMQQPFWKSDGVEREDRLRQLDLVLNGVYSMGIQKVVIPLVDNGSLDTDEQEKVLLSELLSRMPELLSHGVKVVFESDFAATKLGELIGKFPSEAFGVNYDIGNSASLGFDPYMEFSSYGHRISNVHMKDRILGGTTVPLGEGNADFEAVFSNLAKYNYSGLVILQTARAKDGDHSRALRRYYEMTCELMERHFGS